MSDVLGDGTPSRNFGSSAEPEGEKAGFCDQPAFPPPAMEFVPDPVSMLKNPTSELVAELNEFGRELRKGDENLTRQAFENGTKLLRFRPLFRRGEVTGWLEKVVQMPLRDAQLRMQIARAFPAEKHETLSRLTLTSLVKLSGKDERLTPVREQVIASLERGEKLLPQHIEAFVRRVKAEETTTSPVSPPASATKVEAEAGVDQDEETKEFAVAIREAFEEDDETFRQRLDKINPAKIGECLFDTIPEQVDQRRPEIRLNRRRTAESSLRRRSADSKVVEQHAN